MKKLLVVMLVLSMATIASAGLQISVNGLIDNPDSTITLAPSDTVKIDIQGDGGTQAPRGMYLILTPYKDPLGEIYNPQLAEMAGGGLMGTVWAPTSEYGYQDGTYLRNLNGYPAMGFNTDSALYVNGVYIDPQVNPNYSGTIVDNIILHCLGVGDVTLQLVSITQLVDEESGAWGTPEITVWDTQVIHQIPEPMTMALLGLGGLFIRRNRK